MDDIKIHIDNYYKWLKDKTILKQIGEYCEITTPYLDRHNDYIQIYLKQRNDGFILTDDGYTIVDLIHSGCSIDSPKRKKILQVTLNGFGVQLEGEELTVKANTDNFAFKKHSLLQAILAVNDMFYLANSTVASLFFEDVRSWLDLSDIRYTERVTFMGHSSYPRTFDFVISKSKNAPERIIKTVNHPKKAYVDSLIMDWIDTKDTRPENSKPYALLNDNEREVQTSVIDALESYNIKPILWTKRDNIREELAA